MRVSTPTSQTEDRATLALIAGAGITIDVDDVGYVAQATISATGGGGGGPHVHPIVEVTDLQASLDAKETPAGAQAKADAAEAAAEATAAAALSAHADATTAAHGGIVASNDARLTDARTPTVHDHDDRYFTEAETNTLLAAKETPSGAQAKADAAKTGAEATAASALSAHAAAADPHPGYVLDADLSLYLPKALVDAKGDLLVATAADTVARLPAGTDGQVLESRASEATGLKWITPAAGSSPWTETDVLAADQDVTNSAALVALTGLSISVLAGETWLLEILLAYCGNSAAADARFDFLPSAGNMTGAYSYLGDSTTADAILVSTGIRLAAAATITAIGGGTGAAFTVIRTLRIEATLNFSANANFTPRFAQNIATAATTTRVKAGSLLRGRRLA